MNHENIIVTRPSKLYLKRSQLILESGENAAQVPVEDLRHLILDNENIKLTKALLVEIAQNNGVIVVCNERHIPCGIYTSFHQHFQSSKIINLQIENGEKINGKIWKAIIKQKIINQSLIIKELNPKIFDQMIKLISDIKINDETNIEGQAAKIYFNTLFGENFIRRRYRDKDIDFTNILLNYGYSIMRSAVIRALICHGLLPIFGLKHKSNTNSFNLADDFMEPFRPIVDLYVFKYTKENLKQSNEFNIKNKKELTLLINTKMKIDDKVIEMDKAAELMAISYVKALENKKPSLIKIPKLIKR